MFKFHDHEVAPLPFVRVGGYLFTKELLGLDHCISDIVSTNVILLVFLAWHLAEYVVRIITLQSLSDCLAQHFEWERPVLTLKHFASIFLRCRPYAKHRICKETLMELIDRCCDTVSTHVTLPSSQEHDHVIDICLVLL